MTSFAKIVFITAIYGSYEKTCKPFVPQTIPTDFICFTDQTDIVSNGWDIDLTPYHNMLRPECWNDTYYNAHNTHTFFIAKYYKQAFYCIPRLQQYDIVVWLDGTIEITNADAAKIIMDAVSAETPITCFLHEARYKSNNSLLEESQASLFDRYTSTLYFNQVQPVQNIMQQYHAYMNEGYNQQYFGEDGPSIWITCLVGFNMKHPKVRDFLESWYLQTLMYTTQDQIGFPYVCWKHEIKPHTLEGFSAHVQTFLYIKHHHNT